MRLAKYLAHTGVASRRSAEGVIASGRVRVDGQVVRDPARDVTEHNRVSLDGNQLSGAEPRTVYLLHKPTGVLSTASDTHNRPTVVELLPDEGLRLYPVGRLDADSSGLILLTNDGELAHRLTHPSFEVPKTYHARLRRGPIRERALRGLREGVKLEDGLTAPARVRALSADLLEIVIHEGRNRQVRRMCDAVGYPLRSLQRVAFGPLALGDLPAGAHRRLSEAEIRRLRGSTSAVPPIQE